jgi:TPR repeat protein
MTFFRSLVLATAFAILSGTAAVAQDFSKGLAAYEAGDFATAIIEWGPIAKQGYAAAQANLGNMYISGKGVPQDYKEAVKWYRLAAEQGHAAAQLKLGFAYNLGQGVPQDDKEAVKWIRLSAEQGHVVAQYFLGVIYSLGKGVLQHNLRAHMWYNIAAANGHDSADKQRDALADRMTSADVSKAQDMAGNCIKNGYKECGS